MKLNNKIVNFKNILQMLYLNNFFLNQQWASSDL